MADHDHIAAALLILLAFLWWLPSYRQCRWSEANAVIDEPLPETTDEWQAIEAAVDAALEDFARERQASLNAHPSARRILDQIAANEAARVDDEWMRFAKDWSA